MSDNLAVNIAIITGFIIAIILGAIFAGLLLFTVAGTKPVEKYEASVVIEAPPEKVYPWLFVYEQRKKWVNGLTKSVQLTDGGAYKEGAKYQETIDGLTFEREITDIIKDEYLQEVYSSKDAGRTIRYELKEVGKGTELVVTGSVKYEEGFESLLSPFFTAQFESEMKGNIKRLRDEIEN